MPSNTTEYMQQYMPKWRAKHPHYFNDYFTDPDQKERKRVRGIVNNAIKRGEIKRKLCQFHNCALFGEAHHDDYDFPLDIKWLCKVHHEKYHAGTLDLNLVK